MNSSMIVTGPLSSDAWQAIGWDGCETLGDEAHAYMYAQRTADGRIALGGRGLPYRFGSGIDHDGAVPPSTIAQLGRILRRMFPVTVEAGIEHAWCGVLGVPRDWCATVMMDPRTGLGWAGGYTGHGVAAANSAPFRLSDSGFTFCIAYPPLRSLADFWFGIHSASASAAGQPYFVM